MLVMNGHRFRTFFNLFIRQAEKPYDPEHEDDDASMTFCNISHETQS